MAAWNIAVSNARGEESAVIEPALSGTPRLQHGFQQSAHVGGIARDFDAALFHDRELLRRRAFASGNDRTRMTHALARRRRHARNESDHRFLHVPLDPACAVLFVLAADL